MLQEKPDRRGTPPGTGIIRTATGGRIGNPPFEATDEQRQTVRTYAKVMSQEMIASALDVSVDTLQRHFRKELDDGQREAVAAVGGKLLSKALAGDRTCMIFYLRTRGKWSQRVELTGPNGGPIRQVNIAPQLENLTDEQLDLLEPILAQLLTAAGGADLDDGDSVGAGAAESGEAPPGA